MIPSPHTQTLIDVMHAFEARSLGEPVSAQYVPWTDPDQPQAEPDAPGLPGPPLLSFTTGRRGVDVTFEAGVLAAYLELSPDDAADLADAALPHFVPAWGEYVRANDPERHPGADLYSALMPPGQVTALIRTALRFSPRRDTRQTPPPAYCGDIAVLTAGLDQTGTLNLLLRAEERTLEFPGDRAAGVMRALLPHFDGWTTHPQVPSRPAARA